MVSGDESGDTSCRSKGDAERRDWVLSFSSRAKKKVKGGRRRARLPIWLGPGAGFE